ncbi:MAG: FAD:protein FMN transferase [Clostridia bacterium]
MKFIMRHLKLVLTLILVVIIFSGITFLNPIGEKSTSKTNFMLSTLITIKAYGENSDRAVEAAMDRVKEIEASMSAYVEGSDIWNVNHSEPGKAVKVAEDTYQVVKRGLFYSRLTEGNFDITIKPLVDLWGISGEHPKVPDDLELKQAISKIDYQKVILDEKEHTITLAQDGAGIDLGGIAKGYAANEVIKILKEQGINSAYADLGGNVIVLGKKEVGWLQYITLMIKGQRASREKDWRIGLQDPVQGRGIYMATIDLSDKAIVTSGPYERNFEQDNKLYHHILNPFTGYPASSGLISAVIIAEDSMDADALSTSLFLLGEEKGLQFIEAQPGIEAMVINQYKQVSLTKGLKDRVKITNEEYKLK